MLHQKDSFNLNGLDFVSFPLYRANVKSVHEAILQIHALGTVSLTSLGAGSLTSLQEVSTLVSKKHEELDIHTVLVAAIARWISGLFIQRSITRRVGGGSWAIRDLAPIVPCALVDAGSDALSMQAIMIVNALFGRHVARSADDLVRIVQTIADVAVPSVQAPPTPDPARADRIRAQQKDRMLDVFNKAKGKIVVPKEDVRGDVIVGNSMQILREVPGATLEYEYGVHPPNVFKVAMRCTRQKRNLVMKLTQTDGADSYACKLSTDVSYKIEDKNEMSMSPGYSLKITRKDKEITARVLGDGNDAYDTDIIAIKREADQPAYCASVALDLALAIMRDATSADNSLGAVNLMLNNNEKLDETATTILPLYYIKQERINKVIELYAHVGTISPKSAPGGVYQSSDGNHYVDALPEDIVETKERLAERLWTVDDSVFYNQKLLEAPSNTYALVLRPPPPTTP